jgi:hypothetical protein
MKVLIPEEIELPASVNVDTFKNAVVIRPGD